MNLYEKILLNGQDFIYDLDPNVIFYYTKDQFEYVYSRNKREITETITTKQMNSKLELTIQSVLCCRNSKKEPIIIVIALDNDKNNLIFCYYIMEKLLVQVITKTKIKNEITQASITQDSFNVVFMDKVTAKIDSCYGLVIGTATGSTDFLLLSIDELTMEATVKAVEPIKVKRGPALGYVTAIHILPPDKTDARMGHSDPQILLGYSRGAILIFRYRAKIYSANAPRLRTPINLSEFTEYPNYPITILSCARSYNSLTMTVAFSQEKPVDNANYELASPYVKLIGAHGDSTRNQRTVLYPVDPSAKIIEASLLLSEKTTIELDNIIQLDIIYQKKSSFELNIWNVSPVNMNRKLTLELDQETCYSLVHRRSRLRSVDFLAYYKNTPQRLLQDMLQYQKNMSPDNGADRKRKPGHQQGRVKNKRARRFPVSRNIAQSDLDENNELQSNSVDESANRSTFLDQELHMLNRQNPTSVTIEENEQMNTEYLEVMLIEESANSPKDNATKESNSVATDIAIDESGSTAMDNLTDGAFIEEVANIVTEESIEVISENTVDNVTEESTGIFTQLNVGKASGNSHVNHETDESAIIKKVKTVEEESKLQTVEYGSLEVAHKDLSNPEDHSSIPAVEIEEQKLVESTDSEELMTTHEQCITQDDLESTAENKAQESIHLEDEVNSGKNLKPQHNFVSKEDPYTYKDVSELDNVVEQNEPVVQVEFAMAENIITHNSELQEDFSTPEDLTIQAYAKIQNYINKQENISALKEHSDIEEVVNTQDANNLQDGNTAPDDNNIQSATDTRDAINSQDDSDTQVFYTADDINTQDDIVTREDIITQDDVDTQNNACTEEATHTENTTCTKDNANTQSDMNIQHNVYFEEAIVTQGDIIQSGITTQDNIYIDTQDDAYTQDNNYAKEPINTEEAINNEEAINTEEVVNTQEAINIEEATNTDTNTEEVISSQDDIHTQADKTTQRKFNQSEDFVFVEKSIESNKNEYSHDNLENLEQSAESMNAVIASFVHELEEEIEEEKHTEPLSERSIQKDDLVETPLAHEPVKETESNQYPSLMSEDQLENLISMIEQANNENNVDCLNGANTATEEYMDLTDVLNDETVAAVTNNSKQADTAGEGYAIFDEDKITYKYEEAKNVTGNEIFVLDQDIPETTSEVSGEDENMDVYQNSDGDQDYGDNDDLYNPSEEPFYEEDKKANDELSGEYKNAISIDEKALSEKDDMSLDEKSVCEDYLISRDSLSDIGSIQHSFVTASNLTDLDPVTKIYRSPTVDHIPIMEHDLAQLSESINYDIQKADDSSTVKKTPEEQRMDTIEQSKITSEKDFSTLLHETVNIRDIDTFMKSPLVPQDQLDVIGISCWYTPDARMKLFLVRYCHQHNLGKLIVPICKRIYLAPKDFTEQEIQEYKTIYRKYLKKFPSYNEDVNVFTKEGRQELLQKELNRYKFYKNYTSQGQRESFQKYMDYYGFGSNMFSLQ